MSWPSHLHQATCVCVCVCGTDGCCLLACSLAGLFAGLILNTPTDALVFLADCCVVGMLFVRHAMSLKGLAMFPSQSASRKSIATSLSRLPFYEELATGRASDSAVLC